MIILIGGGICEGKDTAAALMMRIIELRNNGGLGTYPLHSVATNQDFWHKRANIYGWFVDRFAFIPKFQCSKILGIPYPELNDHSSPNKRRYRELYAKHAQILKQVYGNDVWAQALLNKYKDRNLVVCDWRYLEEIDAVEGSGQEYCAVILERLLTADMWAQNLGFDISMIMMESDQYISKGEFIKRVEEHGLANTDERVAMLSRLIYEQQNLQAIIDKYPNTPIITNKGLSDLNDDLETLLSSYNII